jgi:sugar lactone lactonase YvrE
MKMNPTILADNLKFPESPRWYKDKLWFCDYSTNKVMKVDLGGNVETVLERDDLPTAIDFTPDGKLLVVSSDQRKLLKLENDTLTEVADMSGLVKHPCGDMVVDQQGRAYIGTVGLDFNTFQLELSQILLVTPEGKARIVAEGMAFPNGIVITPGGKTLIVAETFGARLTAFTIEADGSLSQRRVWAQFDESLSFEQGRFNPDGICLDAERAVWVSSQNQVLRVAEGAKVLERVPLEFFSPACMLGGTERRTLFILSTNVTNPGDPNVKGRIETVEVEVPGTGLPFAS